MSKKEYVFKVLDKVKGVWNEEPIIRKYLMEHDDENYVNYLYDKFTSAVDKTLEQKEKEKLESLSKNLNNLKQKESLAYQADNEDLKKLDDLLIDM